MKSLQVFAVLPILAVRAGSDCYAPSEGDALSCSKCDDQRDNQCVVDGQWFDCKSHLLDCCSTDSMRIAWQDDKYLSLCVARSLVPSQPTITPPPNVFGDCINAVSMRYSVTNRECMTACNNVKGYISASSLFQSGACEIQSYKITDGNADVSDSSCFNNWVYGYSQEAKAAAMNGVFELTNSPAQCQLLCQEQDCVNWIWFSELVRDTKGSEYVGACALKNKTQVDEAVAQKTELTSVIKNGYKWCSALMPLQCHADGFNCLECHGLKRCVWESTVHVAGYKDCSHQDECHVDYPTRPPTTTTTTKKTTTKTTLKTTTPTRKKTTTTTTRKTTTPTTTKTHKTHKPELQATTAGNNLRAL